MLLLLCLVFDCDAGVDWISGPVEALKESD